MFPLLGFTSKISFKNSLEKVFKKSLKNEKCVQIGLVALKKKDVHKWSPPFFMLVHSSTRENCLQPKLNWRVVCSGVC